jgi:hypothetical protein
VSSTAALRVVSAQRDHRILTLDHAGISWKAYLQGLPHPDYQGICYPAKCNGAPDSDPLYVAKHDGIQNFTTSLNSRDWRREPRRRPDRDHRDHQPRPPGRAGPRPANHYSMLSTIQHALGLGCLQHTCDTKHVQPLAALFAVTGSTAIATKPLPVPDYATLSATPSPTPKEPTSMTTSAKSAGGWTVQRAGLLGTSDNSVGAVAGSSPADVWAIGDQEGAGGRFQTLTEHWNGASWSVARTRDPGSSGNHLYAVDAVGPDDVWAVGQQLGGRAPDRGLVEHWNGRRWRVVRSPLSASASVVLDGVVATHGQVWVAGEADSPGVGANWSVDQGPDPGSGSNILGGVTAVGGQLWAAGIYDNGGSELPLIEHR